MHTSLIKEFGFSLPEILVAVGLMGGVSLVMMKVMQGQSEQEYMIKAKAEITNTISLIQTTLSKPENCAKLIGGKTKNTALDNLILDVHDNNGVLIHQQNLLEKTRYKYFRVESIDFLGHPTDLSLAGLAINFRIQKPGAKVGVNSPGSPDDPSVIKRIPIIVTLAADNTTVKGCGAVLQDVNVEAIKKMCLSLGNLATWTSATSTCSVNPLFKCDYGFVPVQLNTTGDLVCQRLEDRVDKSEIFDFSGVDCTSAASFRIETVNGRLKVVCP
jgi:type II secretory pathway pseudopilin PulG